MLGLGEQLSLQEIVNKLAPGKSDRLQTLLLRPPLRHHSNLSVSSSTQLVKNLCGLVSMKGEDLMLQQSSDILPKFQRMRASIPARLWRWRNVSGWRWTGDKEHINVLELRAAFTAMRYRAEERAEMDCKFLRLVDSLVVLHSLTRGRLSSRKLKRTMMRLNSLLLATGLQPTWTYVDTHQNPADKPSRWAVRKPWLKVKRKC